jgi:DNA-binding IclR family transcriptional regulator
MARTSPGVQRMAAVLNFFADHPGRPFTLTDLVEALRLSRATCHALLMGLLHVGYLHRANDKSYILGPAFLNLARVAADNASPAQIVKPEIRIIADELQALCGVFYRDGDDVVLLERAASGPQVGWSPPPGARLKLRAPFSAIFFAWSAPGRAEAWLEQARPPSTPQQRASMRDSMAFARQHGFLVSVHSTAWDVAQQPVEDVFSREAPDFPVSLPAELHPGTEYRLASLAAPVFDKTGEVAFALTLMGWSRVLRGDAIAQIGRRLRASADRMTGFLGGREPG